MLLIKNLSFITLLSLATLPIWCMESSEKIKRIRRHGLIRYYLTHWCNESENTLSPYIIDHIIHYAMPEIPASLHIGSSPAKYKEVCDDEFKQDLITPSGSQIFSPARIYLKNINCNLPNDYNHYPYYPSRIVRSQCKHGKYSKLIAVAAQKKESHQETGKAGIFLYDTKNSTAPNLIGSHTLVGYISHMGFNPTGSLLTVATERRVTLFDTKNGLSKINHFFDSYFWFSKNGMRLYLINEDINSAVTYINLALRQAQEALPHPTLEQANLLLTEYNKSLAITKKNNSCIIN